MKSDRRGAPLLASTEAVKGPGHHNFFPGPDGGDWLVYHGWDPAFRARYPRIDPLGWGPRGPTTVGPTAGPQPIGGPKGRPRRVQRRPGA